MDNQHQKIKGYRDLSQAEIDLMNKIKAQAEACKALVDEVKAHVQTQHEKTSVYTAGSPAAQDEFERLRAAEPYGWASMARADLQVAFMKLVRAVAQPSTF